MNKENRPDKGKYSIYQNNRNDFYYIAPTSRFRYFFWAMEKNMLVFFGLGGAVRIFEKLDDAKKVYMGEQYEK
jgi:hypothetical protein